MAVICQALDEDKTQRKPTMSKDNLLDASMRGNLSAVNKLLAAGANMNDIDSNGITALMNAAEYGYPEVMQALLDAGADESQKDRNGLTVLDKAKISGDDYVEQILQGRVINHVLQGRVIALSSLGLFAGTRENPSDSDDDHQSVASISRSQFF